MALQTKDYSVSGKSGSGGTTYTYILRVTENSIDVVSNTSNVTVQAILKSSAAGTSFSIWGTGVSCTLNGTQIFSDYQKRQCSGTGEHVYYTWTKDIEHNADGTLSLQVGGKLWQDNSASFTPPTLTITASEATAMALTSIARQHTISAASANIEEVAMIAVNNNGDSLNHSIAYSFGSLKGFIDASGNPVSTEAKFNATSVGFKVPASFYAQIPNAPSGECVLTCKTYSGNTRVGDDTQATFVATAARSKCDPVVSGTVVDTNAVTKALTGDANKLVRYYSTALCTMTVTAKNSASIKERKIAGQSVAENALAIPAVESGSFSFWAKDSRGYDHTGDQVNKTLIPYVKLTNEATGLRVNPTDGSAQIRFKGAYYNGSFGAQNNTLELFYRKSGDTDWIPVTATPSGNSYSATVNLSQLEYTQSYSYEVKVKDKLEEVIKSVTIGQGIPVFDWGKDYFNVNVRAQLPMGYVAFTGSDRNVSEEELNAVLDRELESMPNNSAKFMEVHSYSVNLYRYMGYLYRADYDYAAFFGICYDGSIIRKSKFGQWRAAVIS